MFSWNRRSNSSATSSRKTSTSSYPRHHSEEQRKIGFGYVIDVLVDSPKSLTLRQRDPGEQNADYDQPIVDLEQSKHESSHFTSPYSRGLQSDCPRSTAAPTARRKAPRTPQSSSSATPKIVVPAGEATRSLSSAGETPSSIIIRAAPSAICRANGRARARGNPQWTAPSSSPSNAKASIPGPLPVNPVTTSKYCSGTSSTTPRGLSTAFTASVAPGAVFSSGAKAMTPSPTETARFGMMRKTAGPLRSAARTRGRVTPAAVDTTFPSDDSSLTPARTDSSS